MDAGVRAVCSGSWRMERTMSSATVSITRGYGAQQLVMGSSAGPLGDYVQPLRQDNHVIRYNEIYSEDGHYFNDGHRREDNFSDIGFPNSTRHLRQQDLRTHGRRHRGRRR